MAITFGFLGALCGPQVYEMRGRLTHHKSQCQSVYVSR
jgi:hypothetical protein